MVRVPIKLRAPTGASLALLLALGCGGSSALRPAPRPPQDLSLVRPGGGRRPDLAVLARPSGDLVYLALWIDAGSRDGAPPQVATLAAWLAARRAGSGVSGQVWPDAIELATTCHKRDLADCLARFSRALALRQVDAGALHDAQQRLIDARRASAAADPARQADELALRALFGEPADAMLAFGRAQDDQAAGAAQVTGFLAQHFGPKRALLIAAGELDADEVEHAVQAAFALAPVAAHARAERELEAEDGGGVAVDVGDKPALSFALAAADLDSARAGAAALEQRLQRDGLSSGTRGHAFAVRGAALALLRVQTSDPLGAVRAAAHEIERLRYEGAEHTPAQPSGADVQAVARRLALRWATRGQASAHEPAPALGVGLLVAGGRADRVGAADPDAAQRKSWQERAQQAFAGGRALGAPRTTGNVDSQTASVALENGAHIELRARSSDEVAVSLRFAHGAGLEPPLLHGRAALLAVLTTTACAGLSQEQLVERLRQLGARLQPRVDAESWGILLTAPVASWQPALAFALDCALHPALDRVNLAAARLRLRARLGAADGPSALEAVTAEWIAPGAPGTLAPWGSPDRQASVGLPELRELWSGCRRGGVLSVAAIGSLSIADALGLIARRASELPRGPAPDAAPHSQDGGLGEPAPPVDQPTFGLALWRVPMANADAAGAQGFAAVARAALSQSPDVRANWHAGGADAEGGWAAVALSGPPASLAATVAQLGTVVRGASSAALERAADGAFELTERTRAAAASDPSTEAEALARAPFRPLQTSASRDAARALAAKLAQTEPTWLPLK